MKQKLLRNRIMGNTLSITNIEPIDEEEKKRIVIGVYFYFFIFFFPTKILQF